MIEELKPTETAITEDGYILNTATGEVVGVETPDEVQADIEQGQFRERFANWCLSLIQRKEAKVRSLTNQHSKLLDQRIALVNEAIEAAKNQPEYLVLESRMAFIEAALNAENKDRKFLIDRFTMSLRECAQFLLSGKRDRTWTSPEGYGKLSLRKTQGKLEVNDMEKAVDVARAIGCEAAIQEVVTAGAVKKRLFSLYAAEPGSDDEKLLEKVYAHPTAFKVELPGENLHIDIGI